jgi:ATP-binding cassette subfamily B (MDR/TAP) protein 1
LSSRFSSETLAFQGAIGEKNATFIMTLAMLISGFVIAYVKGWKMALVMTTTMPALIVGGIVYVMIIQNKDKQMTATYAAAGGRAEEAIGAIKTVKFLTGEKYEAEKFTNELEATKKKILRYWVSGMVRD